MYEIIKVIICVFAFIGVVPFVIGLFDDTWETILDLVYIFGVVFLIRWVCKWRIWKKKFMSDHALSRLCTGIFVIVVLLTCFHNFWLLSQSIFSEIGYASSRVAAEKVAFEDYLGRPFKQTVEDNLYVMHIKKELEERSILWFDWHENTWTDTWYKNNEVRLIEKGGSVYLFSRIKDNFKIQFVTSRGCEVKPMGEFKYLDAPPLIFRIYKMLWYFFKSEELDPRIYLNKITCGGKNVTTIKG